MADPYKVLGVEKDASQAAIKSAYRSLAKKFHPDVNRGNAAVERRFKEVNAAYDLLSDPEHELLEALGAWGEKSMYGKKYMGVIRSHWIVGENGEVLDARVKVSPAKSIELAAAYFSG